MLVATWHTTQAVARCEEAIAVARAVGARAVESHALSTLGVCLDELGQLDQAIVLHRQARRIAEEVGDAEGIVRTYINLSHVLEVAGQIHDAIDDAREGYQRAHQLGLAARHRQLCGQQPRRRVVVHRPMGGMRAADRRAAGGRQLVSVSLCTPPEACC